MRRKNGPSNRIKYHAMVIKNNGVIVERIESIARRRPTNTWLNYIHKYPDCTYEYSEYILPVEYHLASFMEATATFAFMTRSFDENGNFVPFGVRRSEEV